jgi:hypothetical protein
MHHSQTMEGCSSPLVVKFADTQVRIFKAMHHSMEGCSSPLVVKFADTQVRIFKVIHHSQTIEGCIYRLNMEFIWASCAQLYSLAETPQSPPSPHLGSYTRALLVSQDRRHLFVTPCQKEWGLGEGGGVTSHPVSLNHHPVLNCKIHHAASLLSSCMG